MSDKTDLINSILQRYARHTQPVNLKAWELYYRDAIDRKLWAQSVTPEFKARACQYSIDTAARYAKTPTMVLAAEIYIYGHYRGHAKQGHYWIDPQARDLWSTFESQGQT